MTKSIFRDLVPLRPRHFLSIAATSSQHFLQQNGNLREPLQSYIGFIVGPTGPNYIVLMLDIERKANLKRL